MEKSLEEQLIEAIKLASIKHYGQRDKANKPYIFHLLYVIDNVNDLNAKIVGALHDILEDADITRNDLLNYGFSEDIVIAVEVLTKSKNQKYMEYIENIKCNDIARKVKLIDLKRTMKYFEAYKKYM